MAPRMLLSPQLQEERWHGPEDGLGPMDLCMAAGTERKHIVDLIAGYRHYQPRVNLGS